MRGVNRRLMICDVRLAMAANFNNQYSQVSNLRWKRMSNIEQGITNYELRTRCTSTFVIHYSAFNISSVQYSLVHSGSAHQRLVYGANTCIWHSLGVHLLAEIYCVYDDFEVHVLGVLIKRLSCTA